jgi:hypothetical protein
MRRIIPFLFVIAIVFVAPGCMRKGYVKVSAIEGLVDKVSTRHDAYVDADDSLSDLKKRTYKRSTELLRKVVAEAKDEKPTKSAPNP